MPKMGGFLIILILILSSLIIINSSSSAITKPSVPEFTLRFVDNSYDVPTTHTLDPYIGQEITNQGYHVENKSIEVKIENQPFEPFYNENGQAINLYYNIRIKGHFEQNWTELYRPVYGFPKQSTDSNYTVFSYTWAEHGETQLGTWSLPLHAGSQVDFQAQAMLGYVADAGPFSDNSPREYFEGETSDWSNTQTLTITETAPTTTPSTSQSSSTPQGTNPTPSQNGSQTQLPFGLGWGEVIIIVLLGVVAVLLAAAVVSLRRRSVKPTV